MAFDKAQYAPVFKKSVAKLASAEKVVKAELLTLSRSVLEALHATEDIGYVNTLIKALTPVNKRVAVLYFKVFTGFSYSEEEQAFTRKDKKAYDAALAKANEFLEDPLNNIWVWAERNVEVEAKPFDINAMKKQFESILKKAKDNQISELTAIETFMEAGLSMDTLIALMGKIAGEPAPVKEIAGNEPAKEQA